jgi:hypothetical protein
MSSERHGAEHLAAFTIEMSHSESSMGQRSLLLMGGMVDGRIRGKAEAEPCVEVVTPLNPTVSDLMQMSEAAQVPITRSEVSEGSRWDQSLEGRITSIWRLGIFGLSIPRGRR